MIRLHGCVNKVGNAFLTPWNRPTIAAPRIKLQLLWPHFERLRPFLEAETCQAFPLHPLTHPRRHGRRISR
jgi:hypothetical protein